MDDYRLLAPHNKVLQEGIRLINADIDRTNAA
jgi:hypothetical protein